jgi:hypothetical protein
VKCDWLVRRQKPGAKIMFEPCGRKAELCIDGPEWQFGKFRCKKHKKKK